MARLKVLVTGVLGRIGPHLTAPWKERYDLRTFDVNADSSDPTAFCGDIQDQAAVERAMQGIDVVVHLAATSDEKPTLEELIPNNIIGVRNIYQAAVNCGVRRVVFASSCHAMSSGLRRRGRVSAQEPPRPSSLYGTTKVFGEALGRYYHDKHGLEFVAIRIGAFQSYDSDWLKKRKSIDIWLSPCDAVQIFQKAIETPDVGYAVVHATSRTPVELMGLAEAREILDFEPIDNADDFFAPPEAVSQQQNRGLK